MNTKNTKTAVIILLIIANIFFIYNITGLRLSKENIPPEMIDNAADVLKNNGFIIDRSIIPVKKPASMMYEGVYEGAYSQSTVADIVKSFSGISDEEMKSAADMLGPYGTSYSAGDYRFVFSESDKSASGTDKLSDKFKISITEKSYIDAVKEEETEAKKILLAEKSTDGVQKSDLRQAEKEIKNFLKKYQNQDVKLSFVIKGYEKNTNNGSERVLINQTVGNILIDTHAVYVEIQDGAVKYFSGKWYFGKFTPRKRPLLDSVNILFKCLQIDGSIVQDSEKPEKLEKIEAEYTVMFHDTAEGLFYLVPSWSLLFESGKKLSYNMITGDKN